MPYAGDVVSVSPTKKRDKEEEPVSQHQILSERADAVRDGPRATKFSGANKALPDFFVWPFCFVFFLFSRPPAGLATV